MAARRTSLWTRIVLTLAAVIVGFAPSAALAETITTAPPTTVAGQAPLAEAADAPQAPANSGAGRRLVYCVRCQRAWHINDDNTVARTFLVSGRAGIPRPGTYKVFSKSRVSKSGSVRLDYMVRFARGRSLAIGFHAIPIDRRGRPIQSLSQLGTYRSHGCVRQAPVDAKATWDFAPVGTPVVVI